MNGFGMKRNSLMVMLMLLGSAVFAQDGFEGKKFEQMGTMLPTPNSYRTGAGSPGHEYWQQQADYDIEVEVDDDTQVVSGSETITYTNNSPDQLGYLWLQLEQNMRSQDSDTYSSETNRVNQEIGKQGLKKLIGHDYDLGFKVLEVKDANGNDLTLHSK